VVITSLTLRAHPPGCRSFVPVAGGCLPVYGAPGAGRVTLRPLVQVFLDGLQGLGHVGLGGPAVQGLVVGGAKVAEHRIKVNIGTRHLRCLLA
jgi:hypothetical protein